MVKSLNLWLITTSVSLLLVSCGVNKTIRENDDNRYGQTKVTKKEVLSQDLWTLVNYYTMTYNKFPEKTKDLLFYIKRLDYNDKQTYSDLYKFLQKNQDKLIFVSDSTLSIYDKIMNQTNLLTENSLRSPCEYISNKAFFFDDLGYYYTSDSLSEIVIDRLSHEYKTYYYRNHRENSTYEKTLLEYRLGDLRDLCNGKSLNIDQSAFYKNTYNFLDSLARANNMSRITIPSFVDKLE